MPTRDIDYHCDDVNARGYLAWNESVERRPGVLVFHEGLGLGDFAMERARRLASLVARAVDTCSASAGRAHNGRSQPPARLRRAGKLRARSAPRWKRWRRCRNDAGRLRDRICFGGSVVLELAREGADLRAVVSFHGVLATKMPAASGRVRASVLVCTGADDPLAPPDQVADFENEMRAAAVRDWQVISYGNTLHGFTNPAADGSMMRTAMYNEQADRRSWASMQGLFDEVLA